MKAEFVLDRPSPTWSDWATENPILHEHAEFVRDTILSALSTMNRQLAGRAVLRGMLLAYAQVRVDSMPYGRDGSQILVGTQHVASDVEGLLNSLASVQPANSTGN